VTNFTSRDIVSSTHKKEVVLFEVEISDFYTNI